jgi:hypothetical protein
MSFQRLNALSELRLSYWAAVFVTEHKTASTGFER